MMKRWSLKVKVGLYTAALSVFALIVWSGVLIPVLYYHQIAQLDNALKSDADELLRDLQNFRGAPVDARRPLSVRLIPLALRNRYLMVEGPEGQVIYRSNNLRDATLTGVHGELKTTKIFERNCRLATWQEGPYLIRIGTRLGVIEQFQRDLQMAMLVSLPVVGLLVFIGGLWLGRRAVAPVTSLSAAAERISTANPQERLPIPPARDEIARLTEVLNRTFDRLQQSYDAAARFSADASHQLKTPITILRASLDHLSRKTGLTADQAAEVSVLHHQVRRIHSLIEDLLLLAQADAGRLSIEVELTDLKTLIEGAADDLQTLVTARGIRVETDLPDAVFAMADRRRVALTLQNLIENAAKYSTDGGCVRISAVSENGWTTVKVANTSEPISAVDRESIFERFRRGSTVGENVRGHGLGLNIARELIRAHGGDLVLNPPLAGWNEFEFRLPAGVSA